LRRFSWIDVEEFSKAGLFPDTDFRLSAFGLPEPEGVEWPKESGTWIWLLGAAMGFGLIAILLGWLRRSMLEKTK
jgi:hypothetical protein